MLKKWEWGKSVGWLMSVLVMQSLLFTEYGLSRPVFMHWDQKGKLAILLAVHYKSEITILLKCLPDITSSKHCFKRPQQGMGNSAFMLDSEWNNVFNLVQYRCYRNYLDDKFSYFCFPSNRSQQPVAFKESSGSVSNKNKLLWFTKSIWLLHWI